jgi:hypothetical protein
MKAYVLKITRVLQVIVAFVFIFGLVFPTGAVVWAQDEIPPTSDVEESSPPESEPTGSEPVILTEDSLEDVVIESPVPVETTPEVTEEASEGVESPADELAETLSMLAETGAVVIGSEGEPLSLAAEETADLLSMDPWFNAGGGVVVGYSRTASCAAGVTECHPNQTNSIQAALSDPRSLGTTINIEGAANTYTTEVFDIVSAVTFSLQNNYLVNTINLFTGSSITYVGANRFTAPTVNVNSGANIQTGIDLAAASGTVNVNPGTYTVSSPLTINKKLTLNGNGGNLTSAGADDAAPIITAATPGSGTGISVTSVDVVIKGFIIRNFNTGILVNAPGNGNLPSTAGVSKPSLIISNNTFLNNTFLDVRINDSKDPVLEYNAFLDLGPDGNPVPFSTHNSWALYQGMKTFITANGDFWGCDGTTCGPVAYKEQSANVFLPNDGVQHTGGSNFSFDPGSGATFRQGIVNGLNAVQSNLKLSFPSISSLYEPVCPTGQYFNGFFCVSPPVMCEWDDSLTADDPLCVEPEMCEWDDSLTADDPLCVEPEMCEWDDSLTADDPLCVEPEMCKWDDSLTADDPLCVEPEMCEWDDSLTADDPLCVEPEMCEWDDSLTADDPLCVEPEMCEWDDSLTADDPLCVEPEMCEWDDSLTADDPLCVEPEMCEYDETLEADDPLCVPPVQICMDPTALNFQSTGACEYATPIIPTFFGIPVPAFILDFFGGLIPVTGGNVIVAGLGHTCMTTSDGSVLCWGLNESGQNGDGTFANNTSPVFVQNLDGVSNLAAGSIFTCALKFDGTVWCWGDNAFGQLGNGTMVNSSVPVQVIGLPGAATSLTAGQDFACAMLESSDMYCWGRNDLGQLNDGTTENRSTPVKSGFDKLPAQVSGGQNVLVGETGGKLAEWSNLNPEDITSTGPSLNISGNRFAPGGCAVSASGSVECWGAALITENIPGDSSAITVGTGYSHGCAVNDDASVSCWGENAQGQLGNGSTDKSELAGKVKDLASVGALAVGANHVCVLTDQGGVACWGENIFGQLGNNSTVNSPLPKTINLPGR